MHIKKEVRSNKGTNVQMKRRKLMINAGNTRATI